MTKKLPNDVKTRRAVRRTIESKKNFLNKPNRSNYRQIIDIFLEKFILCEIGTKSIITHYYKSKNKSKSSDNNEMTLTDIKNALRNDNYVFDEKLVDKLFKKNNKRGEKSARDLRNAVVHNLSSNDITELVERWDEIEKILDDYLTILTSEPLE